ncbi:MAG: tetratricopeptide repeat protein [Gammaproteobacteria bacterium]
MKNILFFLALLGGQAIAGTAATQTAADADWPALIRGGNWPEILADARSRPGSCGDDAQAAALHAHAEAAVHLGLWDEAAAALDTCRSRLDTDAALLHTALKLAVMTGDQARMRDRGQRLVALQPDNISGHLVVAETHLGDGTCTAARTHTERILQLAPGHPAALALRGACQLGERQSRAAYDSLNEAIGRVRIAPAAWHLWRAEASAQMGLWETSSRDAYVALLLEPSADAYAMIGQSALALRDWPALQQYASHALASGLDDPRLRRQLATAQEELGNPQEANATWQALLAAYPEDRQARLQLARLATTEEDWPSAVRLLAPLADTYQDGEALALTAFALFRQGKTDAARDHAANALALSPREAMAMLVLADIALLENDAGAALGYCQRARQLLPRQPLVLTTCARVNAALRNLDVARAELAIAEQLAPNDAEVRRARDAIGHAAGGAQ